MDLYTNCYNSYFERGKKRLKNKVRKAPLPHRLKLFPVFCGFFFDSLISCVACQHVKKRWILSIMLEEGV